MSKQLDQLRKRVPAGTVTNCFILVREFRITIGDLGTEVTIRIYYDGRYKEPYFFRTSHFLQTPNEARPYNSDARSGRSEPEAIRRAVRMLTENYESAARTGHKPKESWLHPGDDPL